MKRNYSNESGFTLIEVLIAIAMIGLIMLGFLGMYTHGHRWVFNAGVRTDELFTSQQEIESALGGDAAAVNSEDFTLDITFNPPSSPSVDISIEGEKHTWQDDDGNGLMEAFEPD